jgi:hypothetical protein
MFLALEREEVVLLGQLVEARIAELHQLQRRTCNVEYEREIQHELEQLEHVLHQLHECECDVLA